LRHWPLFLAIVAVVGLAAWYDLSPNHPVRQGLDLKGGMRVILETDKAKTPAGIVVDSAMAASIRQILNDRVNAFGLSGATVASKGADQFVVEIPATPPKLVSTLSGNLSYAIRPGANVVGSGPEATIKLTDKKVPARQATITFEGGTMRLKAEAPGVQYDVSDLPVGQSRDLENGDRVKFGDTALTISIPAGSTETLKQLTRTAQLQFRWFKDVKNEKNPAGKYEMSEEPMPTDPRRKVYTFKDAATGKTVPAKQVIDESEKIATGADLLPNSKQEFDTAGRGIVVHFEFNSQGAAIFADFTRNHVGDILAVVLDEDVITAPRIDSPIPNGSGIISGSFKNVAEARTLAQLLNAGALPVPLKPIQTQIVGATLGQDSVDRSIKAGIYGLIAVLVFMLVYYLLPGVLADIALIFYAALTFAIFKVMNVVLDLPGITGFILSVGMAVDANILIFERLKEEMRGGKTLHAAIDAGFSRAFTSIFDSNMTTWIVCAVLYWLGTNLIKGFALTLAIGVAVSMFTAITITRTMLHLVVNFPWARNPALFGLNRSWLSRRFGEGRYLDVFGQRKIYFGFSILLMVVGLVFLGMGQLKPGIDFTGGSVTQVRFTQTVPLDQVRAALNKVGIPEPQVQTATDASLGNLVVVRSAELPQDKVEAFRKEVTSMGGELLTNETIGPTIAREVTTNAFLSVIVASLAIVLYLAARFAIGGFMNGLKYGVCAVIAQLHDTITVIGLFALGGWALNWHVDSLFVTAVLTVIGFSVHDTIVVYDRIRENLRNRQRGETFTDIMNRSVTQTFDRSINTSFTVVLVLASLLLFGGSVIKLFNVALLIGIVIGTYSSIFVASPLVVIWDLLAGGKASAGKRGTTDVRFQSPSTSRARPVPAGAPAGRRPTASRTNGGVSTTTDDESREAVSAGDGARGGSGGRPADRGSTIKSKRKRRM
jgi:SecD/SecF fusion protein